MMCKKAIIVAQYQPLSACVTILYLKLALVLMKITSTKLLMASIMPRPLKPMMHLFCLLSDTHVCHYFTTVQCWTT